MVKSITSQRDIPAAPYYVLCNDKALSGWGEAKNRINTLIFPCRSYDQARQVEDYARAHRDQRYVRIVFYGKPRLHWGHFYQVKTEADYPSWYGIKE